MTIKDLETLIKGGAIDFETAKTSDFDSLITLLTDYKKKFCGRIFIRGIDKPATKKIN